LSLHAAANRRLSLSLIASLLALLGLGIHDAWHSHRTALRQADVNVGNLTLVLESQLRGQLQMTEHTLPVRPPCTRRPMPAGQPTPRHSSAGSSASWRIWCPSAAACAAATPRAPWCTAPACRPVRR